MLTKRIIPCLDVKAGRVVKGINFENLTDAGDPVELAEFYYTEGADELVFLDITASLEDRKTLYNLVERLAEKIFIPFTVGGGVSDLNDFRKLFKSGADKVSINSAAVENPKLIGQVAAEFGSQAVVVAIDVKRSGSNWDVYVKGGTENTGLDVYEWIKKVEELGAGEILLTSMDRDGTNEGYDLELLEGVSRITNIPIVASGGVGKEIDLLNGINAGADAVLAASVFHYGKYSIREAKDYLKKFNVNVRL